MNKVIKFIIMFILILAIVLIGGEVKAASVGISASTSKVDIGDTVKVTVSFGEKVYATEFRLDYDENKFEYVSNSASGGKFGKSTKMFTYAGGDETIQRVTFTFKSKSMGNSNFSIGNVKVSNTIPVKKVTPTITKSNVGVTAQEKQATTENNNSNSNSSNTNSSNTNNSNTNKGNSNSGTTTSTNKSSSTKTNNKTTSSNTESTNKEAVEIENNVENVEQTNNLVNEISENTISEQELNTIDNNTIDVSAISVKRDINIWQIIAIVEFVIIILLGIAMYIAIGKK